MRVLFITSTRIGDAVLSSGALAWALDRWPQARLTIACGPAAAPLFEAVPNLERLIVLRKETRGRHWRLLWQSAVGRWWTAIIDIRRSAMPYLLPARRRYVLARSDERRHKVEMVTEMLGETRPVAPHIWTAPTHEDAADRLIGQSADIHRPLLALAPTANWGGKEWPLERFIDLADRLTGPGGRFRDGSVAVFSAPDEASRADHLVNALADRRLIDLRGRTDLLTAYSCLRRADLFVGNDSALMHLSAAAGTPTLGLFGPSLDAVYGPWGERCAAVRTDLSYDDIISAPGYDYRSQDTRMDTLPVDRVLDAAEALLGQHGKVAVP